MGKGSIAPPFLNLAPDGEELSFHSPAASPLEKQPPEPTVRKLGGVQSQSGCYGGEIYLLPLPRINPLSTHQELNPKYLVVLGRYSVQILVGPTTFT
jgi:hypothetical protein